MKHIISKLLEGNQASSVRRQPALSFTWGKEAANGVAASQLEQLFTTHLLRHQETARKCMLSARCKILALQRCIR